MDRYRRKIKKQIVTSRGELFVQEALKTISLNQSSKDNAIPVIDCTSVCRTLVPKMCAESEPEESDFDDEKLEAQLSKFFEEIDDTPTTLMNDSEDERALTCDIVAPANGNASDDELLVGMDERQPVSPAQNEEVTSLTPNETPCTVGNESVDAERRLSSFQNKQTLETPDDQVLPVDPVDRLLTSPANTTLSSLDVVMSPSAQQLVQTAYAPSTSNKKVPKKMYKRRPGKKVKKIAKKKTRGCQGKSKGFKWIREVLVRRVTGVITDEIRIDSGREPLDYFSQFFTEELLQMVKEQSNLYSTQKTGNCADITVDDIKDFIAIELLMGIVKMPSFRDYWSNEYRYEPIASVMPRIKYQKIRRFLHFSDNDEPSTDRFSKIRPISDYLREKFLQIPEEKWMSIDEMMVKYKGKKAGSRKQYMKNKPTKWGFKLFVRSGVSGIVYDFLIYSGSDMLAHVNFDKDEEKLTTSSKIVVALVKSMKTSALSSVYFDNWFCSPELVVLLRENYGAFSIGTLRADRSAGAKELLLSDKALAKKGRGSFDEVTDNHKNITVVKWHDNRAVLLTSSYVGSEPVKRVKRWDQKERKYINVTCPSIVLEYNMFMGGVDKGGMLVSFHKTPLKTFKWYMNLFSQFLDLTLINSWLLYKRDNPTDPITLKTFRKIIADSLLKSKRVPPCKKKGRGRPSSTPPEKKKKATPVPLPCEAVRLDQLGHFPCYGQKARCRYCSDTTTVQCSKCYVNLCFVRQKNCFTDFHNEPAAGC